MDFRKTLPYLITICGFLMPQASFSQAKDPDALFTEARREAFDSKNYSKAIELSKQALVIAPNYTDIIVFLGRLYSWEKKNDSAEIYFKKAIEQKNKLEDAYIAYTDMKIWNEDYGNAMAVSSQGLLYNPRSVSLMLRKAKILYNIKDYAAAVVVLDTLLSIDNNNDEARVLANLVKDYRSKNQIVINYNYVSFDKQFPDPWQNISFDYTRQTKAGPFTARINYANRFATPGLQYELEVYPRISKTFYGYVNFGYSNDVGVFPKWRGGVSLYTNLPRAFETETGVRYLYFTSSTLMYVLYVGKYYKSFLFGTRAYLIPQSSTVSQNYSVLARYYWGGADDYAGIIVGYGLSPDDRESAVQFKNSIYKLRSYRAEIIARHSVRKMNVITFNASILNQEYLPNTIGNQMQIGLGYIRRF